MEISTLSADAAAAEAVAEHSSTPLMPPDAAAARQFSNLMQGAGSPAAVGSSQAVTASSPVAGPASSFSAASGSGLGSQLGSMSAPAATPGALGSSLTGLLRERAAELSRRWKDTMSKVSKVDDGSSYSVLLKTQFEVGKINLEHAVMTQGISRSTQNVDSMVKMQ